MNNKLELTGKNDLNSNLKDLKTLLTRETAYLDLSSSTSDNLVIKYTDKNLQGEKLELPLDLLFACYAQLIETFEQVNFEYSLLKSLTLKKKQGLAQ